MLDLEVERLRRLRGAALRLRAVARAVDQPSTSLQLHPLLERGACAAWRVARIVSGRLRAHPFADFQKDAGVGLLLRNAMAAKLASAGSADPLKALLAFDKHLKVVLRQLDDTRALAWDGDLSDSLGRSQAELRVLLATTQSAMAGGRQSHVTRAGASQSGESDWPFVAL